MLSLKWGKALGFPFQSWMYVKPKKSSLFIKGRQLKLIIGDHGNSLCLHLLGFVAMVKVISELHWSWLFIVMVHVLNSRINLQIVSQLKSSSLIFKPSHKRGFATQEIQFSICFEKKYVSFPKIYWQQKYTSRILV